MLKFEKILRLVKVDESTHTAYGIATCESVDCAQEVCDYNGTKPLYQVWSQNASESTTAAGQDVSLGNVRLQHGASGGDSIAGKLTAIDYDDEAKTISVAAQAADDRVWSLIKGGFVTGFSQGGKYVSRKCNDCKSNIPGSDNYCPSCEKNTVVRYVARPIEVSFVDLPCLPEAKFKYIKANGSVELRKFAPKEVSLEKSVKYLVHGADGQMHLPYTDEDSKPNHRLMGAAWAALHGVYRVNKYAGPDKDKAIERLKQVYAGENMDTPAAKAIAWKDSAIAQVKAKLDGSKVNKGMYSVASLAQMLESLYWLRMSAEYEREQEGDESSIPDDLQEDLDNLIETFLAMAAEETSELSAANDKAAKTNKGDSTMTEQEVNLLKAARKSMASHFGKMAKMHKSMAMNHEAMGKCEMGKHAACKDMMEACKADVGTDANPGETGASPMWADHMTKMCKSMMDEHKSMASMHDKMAKGHHGAATANEMMAAAHMEDDGEKALTALDGVAKAEFNLEVEKSAPATTESASPNVQGTLAEMLTEGLAEFRKSDAGKAWVQSEIAKQIGVTIVPDGVKLPGAPGLTVVPRHGQVEKSGNANQSTWSGELADCGFGAN